MPAVARPAYGAARLLYPPVIGSPLLMDGRGQTGPIVVTVPAEPRHFNAPPST